MRTKGNALVKFVASLAVCGFLLGGSAAFAADKDPVDPGSGEKPKALAGPIVSLKDFLDSLNPDGVTGGSCTSSCCWASGCDSVSCSSTSCSATCGSSTAVYNC